MNRRGFIRTMTAGLLVAASLRLSSVTELVIGRAVPPAGMYVFNEGEWGKLSPHSVPTYVTVDGKVADTMRIVNGDFEGSYGESMGGERPLEAVTPEEELWLRDGRGNGMGASDLVWVGNDATSIMHVDSEGIPMLLT